MIQTSAVTGQVNTGIEAFLMLNQSASNDKTSNTPRLVHSRFGEIMVDPTKAIHFTRGMLGIPDRFDFSLVSFPSEKMQQFMLLQSLEEDALSFITLPLPPENAIIAHRDIQMACKDLQIAEANLAVLLIVSVHRSPTEVRLSVNARAPLLIDAERRSGTQYVFQNDAYKIQHMLD
ncbi:MAG: flagellar assembly protein FliW [Alphaproteobacteria bacterium]